MMMRTRARVPALLACLALPAPGADAAAQGSSDGSERAITLDDIRTVRSIPWLDLSPDGSRVVYLLSETGSREQGLWTIPSDGGTPRRVAGGVAVREVAGWSASSASLAFLGEDDEGRGVWTVAPGEAPVRACDVPPSARGPQWAGQTRVAFAARPEPADADAASGSGPRPLVSSDEPPGEAVFVCDLEDGTVSRATAETYHGLGFAWAPEGDRLVVSAQREPGFYGALESDLFLVDPASGTARPLVTRPGVDRSPLWSPDGRSVAFVSGFGRSGLVPNLGVAVVRVEGGEVRDVGRAHDRGGFFEGLRLEGWSPDGRHVHYSLVDGVRVPLFRIPAAGGEPERLSDGRADREVSYAYALSADARTVVFKRSATDQPAELFSVLPGSGQPVQLTSYNGSLAALGVPRAEVVRWEASDGTPVEGLLLRPLEGRGTAPYPLVTILHGGPASAYTLGFPGLQFFNPYQDALLAARGYAVLLPNPRGSGGYGEAFRAAAVEDWGDGPADDVLSGIDHLVEEGIADPERLAIAGWSYGGYLVPWILTKTDRFKAASAGAGVIDLESHYGQSAPQMEEYFGGPPWERPELYRSQSPISFVDRIETPTLIFHGTEDSSVSPSQSELLHAGLRARGVPSVLVRYLGEGHSIRRAEFQDDSWQRLWRWLKRWVRPTQS